MDGLRWLLLTFGLLVIAGVYFYSRRERADEGEGAGWPRKEPTLDSAAPDVSDEASADEFSNEVGADPDSDDEVDAGREPGGSDRGVKAPGAQKIVTLRLVARDGGAFPGDDLILSLRGIGMRHGKFGIFHRIDGDDDDVSIFSAASLVEPGSFDLANIKDQSIPGISLFLVLPGPLEGVEAFDLMISTARTLAQSLDAELLDESGSTLSIQRERYMREEIVQFEHSHLVA